LRMKLIKLICLLIVIPLIIFVNIVKWMVGDEEYVS